MSFSDELAAAARMPPRAVSAIAPPVRTQATLWRLVGTRIGGGATAADPTAALASEPTPAAAPLPVPASEPAPAAPVPASAGFVGAGSGAALPASGALPSGRGWVGAPAAPPHARMRSRVVCA